MKKILSSYELLKVDIEIIVKIINVGKGDELLKALPEDSLCHKIVNCYKENKHFAFLIADAEEPDKTESAVFDTLDDGTKIVTFMPRHIN